MGWVKKNIGTIVSVTVVVFGVVSSYTLLGADNASNKSAVRELKKSVEPMKEKIVKLETQQENTEKKVDGMDKKLDEILKAVYSIKPQTDSK